MAVVEEVEETIAVAVPERHRITEETVFPFGFEILHSWASAFHDFHHNILFPKYLTMDSMRLDHYWVMVSEAQILF